MCNSCTKKSERRRKFPTKKLSCEKKTRKRLRNRHTHINPMTMTLQVAIFCSICRCFCVFQPICLNGRLKNSKRTSTLNISILACNRSIWYENTPNGAFVSIPMGH